VNPRSDLRNRIYLAFTVLVSFPPVVDSIVGAIREFRYSYTLDHELRWDVLTIDTKDDLFYFGCALALFFAYRATVVRSASVRQRLWATALGAGSFLLVGLFSSIAVGDEWGQGILEHPTSIWGWYLFFCPLTIPILIGFGVLLVGWRTGKVDDEPYVIPDNGPEMAVYLDADPSPTDVARAHGSKTEA